ncbi:glucosyl-3-phosphoglycerate synthase [Nocardiopsis chromatogenes]|uniref:glucosyl-3-phosphoglycerate synthase n=1 Tax=Nocardiopsis chromatogenes TaxID=280239 RepID=UPI00034D07A5|nr:glucosyl-3-phosphoglycerate synthase [Nocardiopsis chromatogenes]
MFTDEAGNGESGPDGTGADEGRADRGQVGDGTARVAPCVRDWLRRRSRSAGEWDIDRLRALKGGRRVSVVLPARDEEDTVGDIVAAVREGPMGAGTVDEVVVIDSHSTDGTARAAAEAGAAVHHQDSVRPDLPPMRGKGDAMWKSLHVVKGDIAVFLDADVRGFTGHYVTGLLGPLLEDPAVAYVKGHYDRSAPGPAHPGEPSGQAAGGRVTELAARPLFALLRPELSGFVQPLAGEAAGRVDVLRRVPFAAGYGVEAGLLLDLLDLVGLDALAQVDLGERRHRNRPLTDLGPMALQVQAAILRRVRPEAVGTGAGPGHGPESPAPLLQYLPRGGADPRPRHVDLRERPPLDSVS